MNAPAAPIQVQTSPLPIANLIPSDTHIQQMRRERFDPKLLKELADSIAGVGLLQPLVCRPRGEGKFEIVAGERRYLAARIAGLTAVDANVRELTDDQVLEIQLVENLQREGLHELEEAEGYEQLMKLRGITADDVALKVGKSRSYVYARLKLLALNIEERKAFYAGEIDASRALYVARIVNPKLRAKAFKLASEKRYPGDMYMLSARKLREELTGGEFSVDLRTAPFNQKDVSFFEVIKIAKGKSENRALPDCVSCLNRTGNCLDLFTQGDDPEICTEPACYKIKVRQHSERTRAAVLAEGTPIISGPEAKKIAPRKNELDGYIDLDAICEEDELDEPEPQWPHGDDYDELAEAEHARALNAWEQRQQAHKGRTFRQLLEGLSVPTVLLEDPKDKRIRTLVPREAAEKVLDKAHKIQLSRYNYSVQFSGGMHSSPRSSADTEAQKRELEKQRARQEQERAWRRAVFNAIAEKWTGALKKPQLDDLAQRRLQEEEYGDNAEVLKAIYGKFPVPGQMKEAEVVQLLALLTVIDDVDGYGNPKDLLALAKQLKIDPDKIKKDLKAAAPASDKPATKSKGKQPKKTTTRKDAK